MPIPDLTPTAVGADAAVTPISFVGFVLGTAGDDRLALDGGSAMGNGGADVFVLTAKGAVASPEYLGSVQDFQADDALDLSKLGEKAAIVGREAQDGGERVAIDFDGDGKADGFVLLFNGDATVSPPTQLPTPPMDGGGFVVFPVEWDGGNGGVTVLPVEPDGGNGGVTTFPVDFDVAHDMAQLRMMDAINSWIA